ncbi:hypothetical protein Fcan01_28207 [Folsomia candida]|uniref:Uncharacterized protein n=1 Tax=Folsomia candida TaxID=158441 RepID=A0A226CX95_FOLCA|nr:hypothetical protein Fcan01_28207 [Folsomia candida]
MTSSEKLVRLDFLLIVTSSILLLAVHITPATCRPSPAPEVTTTTTAVDSQQAGNGLQEEDSSEHSLRPSEIMSRVSRSTDHGFYPPTLKNRVHGRAARFHEGNLGPRPLGVGNTMISGYGSPVARMLVHKEAPGMGGGGGGGAPAAGESENLDEQDPTFTPYISARVFNMPQFLDHLKGNLESMTDGEEFVSDEDEFDENDFESLGFGLNGEILPSSGNDPQFISGKLHTFNDGI